MKIRTISAVAGTCVLLCAGIYAEPAHTAGLVDATRFDGEDVWDFHGKKLGDVKHVLVDPQTGYVHFAVIEVDKDWSLDDPMIVVPWTALKITKEGAKGLQIALNSTKEKLVGAPRYKLAESDRLIRKESGGRIYDYWQVGWPEVPTPRVHAVPSSPEVVKPLPKPQP